MTEQETLTGPAIKNGLPKVLRRVTTSRVIPAGGYTDAKGGVHEREVLLTECQLNPVLADAVSAELPPGAKLEDVPAAIDRAAAKLKGAQAAGEKPALVGVSTSGTQAEQGATFSDEQYSMWLVACLRDRYGLDAPVAHLSVDEMVALLALKPDHTSFHEWQAAVNPAGK